MPAILSRPHCVKTKDLCLTLHEKQHNSPQGYPSWDTYLHRSTHVIMTLPLVTSGQLVYISCESDSTHIFLNKCSVALTHWGRDKMAAISQTTFQNGFFFNENVYISITFSLNFVPRVPINNIPALVQIMAWRRSGDKPLSEPMIASLPTHICVTRPQWVKSE